MKDAANGIQNHFKTQSTEINAEYNVRQKRRRQLKRKDHKDQEEESKLSVNKLNAKQSTAFFRPANKNERVNTRNINVMKQLKEKG